MKNRSQHGITEARVVTATKLRLRHAGGAWLTFETNVAILRVDTREQRLTVPTWRRLLYAVP